MSVLTMIDEVLRRLGCETSAGNGKVRSTCPFARVTHAAGRDEKPSFVVFPTTKSGEWPPIYSCQACGETGSFEDLILTLWARGVLSDGDRILLSMYASADGKAELSSASGRLVARSVSRFEGAISRVSAADFSIAPWRHWDEDGPWHDRYSIAQCSEVPELPAGSYDEFEGGVPRYAIERGLAIETCKAWNLGHNRADKRLMFPLYDERGRLVAYSGRSYACRCGSMDSVGEYRCSVCKTSLADGAEPCPACGGAPKKTRTLCSKCGQRWPPKYLHSYGFKRNLFLYGEHRRKIDRGDTVYVVEGNIDAPMLWQAGYRPAVSTLGSNVVLKGAATSVHVEKMIAWWGRVVIVRDGDEAGRKMAAGIVRAISGRILSSVVDLPDGFDPARMVQERPDELRKLLGNPTVSV